MHLDPYVAIAGLIVGFVVGLTGMGGGALMTPILVLLFKVQPLTAVSSDLVAAMVMKPVGSAVHIRRRTVQWDLVRWLMVGSIPAAFAGVFVLRALGNSETLQTRVEIIMGIALVVASAAIAVKAWLQNRQAARRGDDAPLGRPLALKPVRTVLIGAVGGLIVGMTSVGSGSLIIVMLLFLYPTLRGKQLVGTDLVQAVPLVASAAVAHILFGDFQLSLTTSVLIGSVPGVYFGARLSSRAPDGLIRPALAFVLLGSGLKLLSVPTTDLALVLGAVALLGLPTWGALDAAARPQKHWTSAGLSKRLWVGVQALGALFGLGFAAAIAYFARTRPRLEAAALVPADDPTVTPRLRQG